MGVLEADEVMANEMKGNVMKEHYRRVKKLLETKVNSANDFKAINTWEVSVVTYSVVFLRGSRVQLQEIDREKKWLTMQNGFRPKKSNVDWLYLPRGEGGRGLIGVHKNVEIVISGLQNYVRNNKDTLLIAACTIEDNREIPNEYKKSKKNEMKTKLTQKQLHG